MSQVRRGTKKTSQRPEVGRPGKNPAGACKPLKRDVHAWQRGQHRQRTCRVPTGAAARTPIPIRHNDPPDAAPPATRYRTGPSHRERPIESSRRPRKPAIRAKPWHKRGRQKRHTRGPQGSLPFRRVRRRRPGSLASAWRHEAARTTYEELAPPRSPAAADDYPAASRGEG